VHAEPSLGAQVHRELAHRPLQLHDFIVTHAEVCVAKACRASFAIIPKRGCPPRSAGRKAFASRPPLC
jgi:hypothetical protein